MNDEEKQGRFESLVLGFEEQLKAIYGDVRILLVVGYIDCEGLPIATMANNFDKENLFLVLKETIKIYLEQDEQTD